ncbi:hypothetical protein MMC22_000959 [Lobaria immixta]|nr:hypothetical protein [Lobaria immixta]
MAADGHRFERRHTWLNERINKSSQIQQGSAEFPTDRFIPLDLNDVQPTTSVGPSYTKWENWSAKKKSKKRTIDSPPRGTEETLGQVSAESSTKEVVPFELNVTQPTPSTELSISDWKVLSTKESKSTLELSCRVPISAVQHQLALFMCNMSFSSKKEDQRPNLKRQIRSILTRVFVPCAESEYDKIFEGSDIMEQHRRKHHGTVPEPCSPSFLKGGLLVLEATLLLLL